MHYTRIPGTDLQPSALCLGTADMGTQIARPDAFRILDAYVERGGNFLDTAAIYANWVPGERSVSEKLLGQWLSERGLRTHMIVATKGGHLDDVAALRFPRLAPDQIAADLHASLQHLCTETIDLYWLHRDDPTRPVAEIMETLNAHVRAGHVRYLGCSNWRLERLQAAQRYAAEHGLQGFVATQVLWNLAVLDWAAIGDPTIVAMDAALWQYQRDANLAAIPFSSQANGLFQKLAAGQAERIRSGTLKMYSLEANQSRLERVQRLMRELNLSVTQIVLGYLLSQPFPTVPIVGPHTLEQVEDSLSAGSVRLSPEQVRFLETGV